MSGDEMTQGPLDRVRRIRERREDEPPCVDAGKHEWRIVSSGIEALRNMRVYDRWCPRCLWTMEETFPHEEPPIIRVCYWREVQEGEQACTA